ncbi:MAG: transposase [Anaerovoracaceae bacterium]
MATQHDKQFKLDAIQYYEDHKDLGLRGCAENLGIGYSTLTKWRKEFRESGDIPVRGSGNYSSDEQKEIARLKRELRDAQDVLDVLKKLSTFWENDGGHLFFVSGTLCYKHQQQLKTHFWWIG